MKKPARSASGTFHSVARRASPNNQVDGGVINGKSGLFLEVVLRQTLSKKISKKIPAEATRSPGHESMARQPQPHSRKKRDSNVDEVLLADSRHLTLLRLLESFLVLLQVRVRNTDEVRPPFVLER